MMASKQTDMFPTNYPAEGTTHVVFNGPIYEAQLDKARLTGQIADIYNLMNDNAWRTLSEISQATGHGEASVSAQLRHLRKERFGSHTIEKRPRGERKSGLWEYRIRKGG